MVARTVDWLILMRGPITCRSGFIGSAVARRLIAEWRDDILVFDKLTYAGNMDSLAPTRRYLRAGGRTTGLRKL